MTERSFPRTILFDLDDTILDDRGSIPESWRGACLEACGQLPGPDPETLYQTIEQVRSWFWSDLERHRIHRQDLHAAGALIVAEALTRLDFPDDALATRIAHDYRDRRANAIRPFDGAIATLEALRARGVRLGLVTNGGPAQRRKLERFDLTRHFDHIQIEVEFGLGKPEPTVFHAALASLGATAADTWMVGDSLIFDIAPCRRLGIHSVWLDRLAEPLPDDRTVHPDRTIHAIAELLR